MNKTNRTTQAVAAGALLLAGLGAGVALGATGSASADTSGQTGSGRSTEGPRNQGTPPDPTRSMRSDEKLLTGTTADKVRAAALAKYPNATVQRVETDSDGVYEAHVVTAAGDWVTVQVGKDFAVTGTQTGGPGGPGGHGGPGDHDGDGGYGGTPPSA